MESVLIILAVMGFASVALALYILADANRTYIGDDETKGKGSGVNGASAHRYRERSPKDRRSGRSVSFPLMIDGVLIMEDRRKLPDRRGQGPRVYA